MCERVSVDMCLRVRVCASVYLHVPKRSVAREHAAAQSELPADLQNFETQPEKDEA